MGRLGRKAPFTAVVVAAVALIAPGPGRADDAVGRYRTAGDPGGFRNTLPPGQDGSFTIVELLGALAGGPLPLHATDQVDPYAQLVLRSPGVTEADVDALFKDASFGVPEDDVDRVYNPLPDVTVVRDRSAGVPHIFGTTRYATMYAQGYTGAEDRLFFMDALRHYGRSRLSEFAGGSAANQALDAEQLAVAPYTEAERTAQLGRLASRGPTGRQVVEDFDAYIDGVNAYIAEALLNPAKLPGEYVLLQRLPHRWVPEDVVAVASLIGGLLGKGGGGELQNLCGLDEIAAVVGADEARLVFDDLRMAADPEAPTTSARPVPYRVADPDPATVPPVDCASLRPVDPGSPSVADVVGALGSATTGVLGLEFPRSASNALLVAADRTATGTPVAVFGPQVSYRVPQILIEKDVHGPGIDARGAAFPGLDMYVLLGRGRDYAWSATSSGADNVDQWVLRLCDPGGGEVTDTSMGYVHDGACLAIDFYQHTQVAIPTPGGIPDGPDDLLLSTRVERAPHYGPLVARGRLVDGTPIAVASDRSTYHDEVSSAIGFSQLNDPMFMAGGFDSFRRATGDGIDFTFNWFYVDAEHIGFQHSCRCPERHPNVDPDLPTWGDGRFDYAGELDPADQPWDLDPASGFLTSWNNRPAPMWGANDRQYAWGPVNRSLSLDRALQRAIDAGPVTRAGVVDAMADAATVDPRGSEVLPELLAVLGDDTPPDIDPRAAVLRDGLATWLTTGAHRRDTDADGTYDDPFGPAALDAWWPLAAHAIFDPASGGALDALGIPINDPPQNHIGSAFEATVAGQLDKDLRQVLGRPVSGPFHRTYCGGGDLDTCRQVLWGSLAQAATVLENETGSPDPAAWNRAVADDELHFEPLVAEIPPIPWQNRPTFQQVVQLPPAAVVAAPSPSTGATPPAANRVPTAPELPATGHGDWLLPAGLALTVAVLVARRASRVRR